ncbi:DUF3025 domain-containing protein [Aliiglaciecola sp. CAU 1673]|uniref:DUF3025 domain-containing protein n=1 Tax=Aliiglaciecola sp. CAU 1673 TaxID=3032595 RepID=UPI0023DB30A4|nr:DUF3025 domain-containing protein [Aliiglaciecola sp. CAU 1673]MDF2180256.1 DUF3025 domain-containing protein [Aliiglaciecola sp. CAU 1673]
MSDRTSLRFADSLPQQWHTDFLASEPFALLERLFRLSEHQDWPGCEWLTQADLPVSFATQQSIDFAGLSYEEFIAHHGLVPTREHNWHDLFNALVWRQFPRSKEALNLLHMADIQKHGAKQRTPRRNRITHFDECGVLLAYSNEDIPRALSQHQWQTAMVDKRHAWGNEVKAFVFGHANYEMLLNPYIGLTGKWLGIAVEPGFFDEKEEAQLRHLDNALHIRLQEQDCLAHKGALHPLPLLGVPGWWPANESPAFYDNQSYFMPKPTRR